MRILVSTDQHHHPYQAFSHTVPSGLNSRLVEGLLVEEFLVGVQEEKKVQLHVRLGDLFDRKYAVDATTFFEVAKQIRIQSAFCPQYILKGNHDVATAGRSTIAPLAMMENVFVIEEPFHLEDARLALLPYTEKAIVTANAAYRFNREGACHLLGHMGIRGAKTGSEYVLPEELTLADLSYSFWSGFILVGHIHHPQMLGTKAYYVGSMLQRTFSDVGPPRRVVVLDTDADTVEWIPVPAPEFRNVVLDEMEDLERLEADSEAIGENYYKVVIKDHNIEGRRVDAAFDGRCLGWQIAYDLQSEYGPPRLSLSQDASYDDICNEYVDRTETNLDKEFLKRLGKEIRDNAVYTNL